MSLVHPRQSAAVNAVSLPVHRGLHTHATPSSYQRLTPASRHSVASCSPQKRSFFGVGEILQVVANVRTSFRLASIARLMLGSPPSYTQLPFNVCKHNVFFFPYLSAYLYPSLAHRVSPTSGRSTKRNCRIPGTSSASSLAYLFTSTKLFPSPSGVTGRWACFRRGALFHCTFWCKLGWQGHCIFITSLSFALKSFRRLLSCDSSLRPTSTMYFTLISESPVLRTWTAYT